MNDFPWAQGQQAVLHALNTSELGLTQEEAAKRLEEHGLNELKKKSRKTKLEIFFSQFTNFLVLLLLVAAGVSLALGEIVDAVFILLIVVINAIFGFVQEYRAENALEALKKLAAPQAQVIRGGKEQTIDAKILVPGDVVELQEGDRIPADARLIESYGFETLEAALTGESTSVAKDADIVLREDAQVADRANMIFLGTSVARGRATAVVTATSMQSEFGKIALLVGTITEEKTPLEEKLDALGKKLGIGAVAICLVIFALGLLYGQNIVKMFFTTVSLLVAAVPEGLPAVVTITLALGVQRMVGKKAVVRKLPAVETLGSTTVICSDKTGTLTKNEMSARVVSLCESDVVIPEKDLFSESGLSFARAMEISCLCNNARLIEEKTSEQVKTIHAGDPTEVALLALAKKTGTTKENLETQFEFITENSFDSDRKMMSVVYRDKHKKIIAFVKGAAEKVIAKSANILTNDGEKPLTSIEARKILEKNSELASQALRVIALAYKPLHSKNELKQENVESELTFVGLVGIIDPPRPEVKQAIQLCRDAGIKVVMVTGDNEKTATAIARELGISDNGLVINASELEKISDADLSEKIKHCRVFARVNPSHKMRIVEALQANGEVIAMTGDGVNDAPALKKADIGIAMGRTGTEVARESSKMVLLDDNFATIVAAVEEGRKIYDNVAKSVKYLIACNLGEIIAVLIPTILPSVFRGVIPLTPVQILWMNVATDSAPALALGTDAGDPNAMKAHPRNPKEGVINKKNFKKIIATAFLIGGSTLAAFLFALQWGIPVAATVAFSTIVISELLYSFTVRSTTTPLYKMNLFENKLLLVSVLAGIALQIAIVQGSIGTEIFDVVPLSLAQWLVILAASLSVVFIVELHKVISPRFTT